MKAARFMQVRRMYSRVGPAHVRAKPVSGSGACTLTPHASQGYRMFRSISTRNLVRQSR